VQPVHKGVTEIGALGAADRAGRVGNIAISWTIRFMSGACSLIFANLVVVKISGKINHHAGFDFATGRGVGCGRVL
jgi:hypothetical protein